MMQVPNKIFPILIRIKRKVGKPTAAVILRTCLNLPSVIVIEIQLVGPCLSSRIFWLLNGNLGSLIILDFPGFVVYFLPSKPISTPFFRLNIAFRDSTLNYLILNLILVSCFKM